MMISRSSLLRMKNVSDKSYGDIENTHFVFSNFFFLKSYLYEIMRKNIVDPEFITNLMHNFSYSIIILHHDPQHVSSIAVLIFRRTIAYLQYLVLSHSVWQHTECDDTRYCKYTIVLLKMSTAMLETC
jgi:hypothetical protein